MPPPEQPRKTRSYYVWVPSEDLALLARGRKTEVRVQPRRGRPAALPPAPSPCCMWSTSRIGREDRFVLMLLERAWLEPLGSIGAESLRREGFNTLKEFRRYWIEQRGRKWRPLDYVRCFRVRVPEDAEELGLVLLDRLYREHVDAIPTRGGTE